MYNGYTWDGEKWGVTANPTASGAVRYDLPQGLTASQQRQGRDNIAVQKKNYIINGAMMVSQENGTTAVGVGAYPVDQWSSQSNLATGVFNYAQVSAASTPPAAPSPAGSPNRLRLKVTTAQPTPGANIMLLTHRIEGLRVADLMWGTANAKTVTLQLGMKSHVAGNFPINLFNNGETAAVSGAVTIAAGEIGVDVVKTMTIAGPTSGTGWNTDNTYGMEIAIYMVNGGNANVFATNGNVFELFDVSLTEGAVAPPFMVPDYASELLACKRYFYNGVPLLKGVVSSLGTSAARMSALHPVAMRTAPTFLMTAQLPVYDGGATSVITSAPVSYATATVLECDTNISPALTAFRAVTVYQGAGGNMNVSARL